MEIVVVSDTVRQRRSRTPLSSTPTGQQSAPIEPHERPMNVMPDLLPKTFHLVESNSLFSQINSPNGLTLGQTTPEIDREQLVSVVEIRESNLSMPTKAIATHSPPSEMQISGNVGQVLNSCSILESVNYLEPSDVETVHIIDATSEPSDTETRSSTPNLNERPYSRASDDGSSTSENEYEICNSIPTIPISKSRISFDERKKKLQKDRDFLEDLDEVDNSNRIPTKPMRKKQVPKELLLERDSFYDADKEVFDEPLTFSDDDDNQTGTSTELVDRHTVLINHKKKEIPFEIDYCFSMCFVCVCVQLTPFIFPFDDRFLRRCRLFKNEKKNCFVLMSKRK